MDTSKRSRGTHHIYCGKLQWCFDVQGTRAKNDALFNINTELQRKSGLSLQVSLAPLLPHFLPWQITNRV